MNGARDGTRYGSRFAHHLVKRAFMTTTQVIVGEDPRRIRSECTKLWHRTQNAVKYTFVSRRDDGSRGFAYSRVIGAYAGGFISRAWHQPPGSIQSPRAFQPERSALELRPA